MSKNNHPLAHLFTSESWSSSRVLFGDYESDIYSYWLDSGYFEVDMDSTKPPFSMLIPPPNITGNLHIGHALNTTLQDMLARYHRLRGYEVLWSVGTDHAGIATQNVVERELLKDGVTRHDLGREKFVERVWEWKEEYGSSIKNQLMRIGASCDWSREWFTMDDNLSRVVRHTFVEFYNKGLIYRGEYMVNWCPRCLSAISDLETNSVESKSLMYDIKYPLAEGSGHIVVSTTRPETYFADVAVAVHPDDDRYKHLIGKMVELPLVDRSIPIIADDYVDMEFGSACLKVTPSHDANDFEIGKRHNLEHLEVINADGTLNQLAGKYAGLDRFEARKQVVQGLEEAGYLIATHDHTNAVGSCDRCSTIIEPRLSEQWFLSMKDMADVGIHAVKSGEIKLHPPTWQNLYFDWMTNIRDWCISRQLWWGHRIPAYYCHNGHTTVCMETPTACSTCGGEISHQDPDVLDTWYSSQLLPFAVLGWPEDTAMMDRFYPSSVLSTGFDIIFFWVARMIMMGYEFTGKKPFDNVYFHALVRDSDGQKMSKSKGNVVNPLEIVDKYGADTLRMSLAAFAVQGRDIKLDVNRIEGFYHFTNKIWNASRFVMINAQDATYIEPTISDEGVVDAADRWIIMELNTALNKFSQQLEGYNFGGAMQTAYDFFWSTYCDWYLEVVKVRLAKVDTSTNHGAKIRDEATSMTLYVLRSSLIMLHSVAPFLTEYIYQQLPNKRTQSIMVEEYPNPSIEQALTGNGAGEISEAFQRGETEMGLAMEFITMVRNIRGEYNIPAKVELSILVRCDEASQRALEQSQNLVHALANVETMNFVATLEDAPEGSATKVSSNFEVAVNIKNYIDIPQEIARLEREKKGLLKDLTVYSKKLENKRFLESAPKDVIAKDRAKVADLNEQLESVVRALSSLT